MINRVMKTFKDLVLMLENTELEHYRKHALKTVKSNLSSWKKTVEHHLGDKVHHAHPHGSVTDRKRFKETSDIDVVFHTVNKNKPAGPDHEASEELSGKLYHHDTGHIDVAVYNHHHKDHIKNFKK